MTRPLLLASARPTLCDKVASDILAGLERQQELRDELEFDENVYWRRDEDRSRKAPFCPACFDGKATAVRMQHNSEKYSDDFYECPVCQCRANDFHGSPTLDPNRQTHAQMDY